MSRAAETEAIIIALSHFLQRAMYLQQSCESGVAPCVGLVSELQEEVIRRLSRSTAQHSTAQHSRTRSSGVRRLILGAWAPRVFCNEIENHHDM
jgi:hypothetical protein